MIFLVTAAGLTGCQTTDSQDRARETEYFDWNDPYVNRDPSTIEANYQ